MTGLLNARRERRVADAVIRDPEEHTVIDERRRRALDPGRRRHGPGRRARRALERHPPRAPGAHLLEVPLARDARADPRHLHRHGAPRRPAVPAVRAAALPRARVRGGGRPRDRALADRGRAARLPPRPRRQGLPGDRRAPLPAGGGGLGDRARRGRGRELLPRDRDLADEVRLLAHAVEDPRARHPRLPALARAPGPRAVGGRALRPARDPRGEGRLGHRRRHAVGRHRRARRGGGRLRSWRSRSG